MVSTMYTRLEVQQANHHFTRNKVFTSGIVHRGKRVVAVFYAIAREVVDEDGWRDFRGKTFNMLKGKGKVCLGAASCRR